MVKFGKGLVVSRETIMEKMKMGGDVAERVKLLAVDDERQNTKILEEILSFYPKYYLITVSSGEEAFAVLDKFNPEIVLLDIMMPGINGYEVCRRIREMKNHAFAKIIMLSGLSLVDDRLKAYEAGADDYISKPFVEDELIAKLEVFSKLSRMEEVDELKTTALNILSHETRTPLNGIFLSLDLLSEEIEGNHKAERYVDMLRVSSDRLKFLLEKIGRYCEVKSGLQIKEINPGNIREVLGEIIEEIKNSIKKKIEFDVDCNNTVEILTEWALYREAIREIILKAVNNSTEGGKIWVTFRDVVKKFHLIVEDEGQKPSEDQKKKIFQGLYTPNVLNHSSGIGLGLAISEEIIKNLGGDIECDNSIKHGGTKFIIILNKY